MFKLTVLEDILRTSPERFSLPKFDALSYALHRKYSNRVLPGVGKFCGICIVCWSLMVNWGRFVSGFVGLVEDGRRLSTSWRWWLVDKGIRIIIFYSGVCLSYLS